MSDKSQSRFIAVVHMWFVYSEGFIVYDLESTTAKQADAEVAMLYREHNTRFKNAAVRLIEIKSGESVVRDSGRRLTLWERFTGWCKS